MTAGFRMLPPGVIALPAASPGLQLAADFSDLFAAYAPTLVCEFQLGQYGLGATTRTIGAYRAVPLTRPPITALGVAADLVAGAYAASTYSRAAITGLAVAADFRAPAYAAATYVRPAVTGLGVAVDFKTPGYSAATYTRPAILSLLIAADFKTQTFAG